MKFEYDEAASEALHTDVVHEVSGPSPVTRWVEAMRRLNVIDDPLARKLLKLHERCGSGEGQCDAGDMRTRRLPAWGCETTAAIAQHFGIEYPEAPEHQG